MKILMLFVLTASVALGKATPQKSPDEEIVHSTPIRRDLNHPSRQEQAKSQAESSLLTIQQADGLTAPSDNIIRSQTIGSDGESRGPVQPPHYQEHRPLQQLDRYPQQPYPGQTYPPSVRFQEVNPNAR